MVGGSPPVRHLYIGELYLHERIFQNPILYQTKVKLSVLGSIKSVILILRKSTKAVLFFYFTNV